MKRYSVEEIKKKAVKIRELVLRSLAEAGSGHTGGSLGMADIFASLYFGLMTHDPQNPSLPERDRLILSIGHIAPVLYASLATAGYFPEEEMLTLRKLGSRLQGHPGRDHGLPGIELSAGSLGQGFGAAVGMALAAKHNKQSHHIFCISGDGELQEGSIWEAAMSAAHHKLDNLLWIIDRNKLQIDGDTEKVMSLEPLDDKLTAFGWRVWHCQGNSVEDFLKTSRKAMNFNGIPSVIIARTTMGKGVPEIENKHEWHGKAPTKEQAEKWIALLRN